MLERRQHRGYMMGEVKLDLELFARNVQSTVGAFAENGIHFASTKLTPFLEVYALPCA